MIFKDYWPFRIRGYEKFWGALLAGSSQTIPIAVTLYGIGKAFDIPELILDAAAITTVVTNFWTTLWAAFGAYIATNNDVPTDTPPVVEAGEETTQ